MEMSGPGIISLKVAGIEASFHPVGVRVLTQPKSTGALVRSNFLVVHDIDKRGRLQTCKFLFLVNSIIICRE